MGVERDPDMMGMVGGKMEGRVVGPSSAVPAELDRDADELGELSPRLLLADTTGVERAGG